MLNHRSPLRDLTWQQPETPGEWRVAALVIAFGLALAGAALFFAERA